MMNCKGTYTFIYEDIQNGDQANDKINGKRIYKTSNGDTYNGYWKHGLKTNQFIMTYTNGKTKKLFKPLHCFDTSTRFLGFE